MRELNNKIKTLRVMGEYHSSGIWLVKDNEPHEINLREENVLNISNQLRKELKEGIDLYNRRIIDGLDIVKFDKIGLNIAKKLKAELPEYRVEYCYESDNGRAEVILLE